jgi:Xaa-Pro aminopeptidase
MRLTLPPGEHPARIDKVRAALRQQGRDAMILSSVVSILYLTGFRHSPTERPVVLVVPADGEPGILIPQLEQEHLPVRVPWLKMVQIYPEYPDLRHPFDYLKDLLARMGLASGRLAADSSGYGAPGYRGPALKDLLGGAEIALWPHLVEELRLIKSPAEIELIRSSVVFGNLQHRFIQDIIQPGKTEIELSLIACAEGVKMMFDELKRLGLEYVGQDNGSIPVPGGLIAGPASGLPHPLDSNRPIEAGDVIISWSGGAVLDGHTSELERTMILGAPTAEQRRLFGIMLAAQDIAFSMIRPGAPCSVVDQAVYDYAEKMGALHMRRHHSGHGRGYQGHEAPFFDRGDNTILRPGMVLSVEPGFYVPGVAGFRHSDTIVVTESGCEILTNYPRSLEELTIPVS